LHFSASDVYFDESIVGLLDCNVEILERGEYSFEVVDVKDAMVVKEGNDGTIRCISPQSGSNYGLADLVASCHPKYLLFAENAIMTRSFML